jgi:hypothetical protein
MRQASLKKRCLATLYAGSAQSEKQAGMALRLPDRLTMQGGHHIGVKVAITFLLAGTGRCIGGFGNGYLALDLHSPS